MVLFQKYLVQATAAVTVIVGQIVAYFPTWQPNAAHTISVGSFALAIALLGHDAIKQRTVHTVTGEAEAAVAVDKGEIRNAVRAELREVFGSAKAAAQAAEPAETPPAPADTDEQPRLIG